MATALLPFDEWVAGTLQNSVPANNNALRSEVLSANVISDSTTAQPGSPADGDCYIVPAGATGTQWATFTADSLAYFRGGTWYEFTAYEGLLKVVAGVVKLYNGSSWEAAGGGGIDGITIEENGTPVATDVTTVNFAGSNVSATQTSPGVVEVEFTGGGGGGGGGGGATFPDPGVQPWGYITANVAGSGFVNIGGLAIVATGTGAARTVSGGSLIESLPPVYVMPQQQAPVIMYQPQQYCESSQVIDQFGVARLVQYCYYR